MHGSKKDMLLFLAITSSDDGMYSSLVMFKELLSFPWRPGDLLCVGYLSAVMNIVVLFVDTVKAKECNASYPCYSLFHTSELEAKEDKVGMFNGYPVVINEVSMAYLFSAMHSGLWG